MRRYLLSRLPLLLAVLVAPVRDKTCDLTCSKHKISGESRISPPSQPRATLLLGLLVCGRALGRPALTDLLPARRGTRHPRPRRGAERVEEQGQVAAAELPSPLLVVHPYSRQLLEQQGYVVDLDIEADGTRSSDALEQTHIQLLRPPALAVEILCGLEGPGQAQRQRVGVGVHHAAHEAGESVPSVALIGQGFLHGGDVDPETVGVEP